MELRQLEYFVMVAEELHFDRAAARLHIAQPAVSQQIRRLESDLGVKLFDRSSRQVALSTAGRRTLPRVRALLDGTRQLRAVALGEAEAASVVRIGTTEGLGDRLERLLEGLSEREPELQIALSSDPVDQRIEQVRDGRLDAAFARAVETAPGLFVRPVWRDRLVAALPAGHVLASRPVVELTDLADIPLRLAERQDNPPFVDLVLHRCREAGFEPLRHEPFGTLQNALTAIGFGRPSWTVLHEGTSEMISPRRVAFRPIVEPTIEVTTSVVVSQERSPLQTLVLEMCERQGSAG